MTATVEMLADYSSCTQLCQDVAELINDRNIETRRGISVACTNGLIQKDLLNLKGVTEKLKFDLFKTSNQQSFLITHREIERRQNLLDTLTTRVRILTEASDSRAVLNHAERASLLSAKRQTDYNTFENPWLESEDCITNLTPDEFRERQRRIYREQDAGLDVLASAVERQKEIGITIGHEADYQNELIEEIQDRVVETDAQVTERVDEVKATLATSSTRALWVVIIVLGIAIIVVAAS